MTIDEAIKHAEEVASRLFDDNIHCIKCAEEHEQLAGWLKELKAYKEKESKTGHWIDVSGFGYENYKCSECGDHFLKTTEDWWSEARPNYCPNCGVKMVFKPLECEEVKDDT